MQLFHNIIEENGLSIKENNMKRKHNIPIGTIVETEIDDSGPSYDTYFRGTGKFYVISHDRDCDGTPLYSICLYNCHKEFKESRENGVVKPFPELYPNFTVPSFVYFMMMNIKTGYSEESLKIVS